MKVQVINGPNLNLLGQREPEIYGRTTLADIENRLVECGRQAGVTVHCRQSNHEGDLVEAVHACRGQRDAIIINPGAYSHTSVALLDALSSYDGRVVEVHLSNIHKRESFRHHSYVSTRADAVICGMGPLGYTAALDYLIHPD